MNLQFLKPLKDIPQNRFEQSEGYFSKDKPCCFGAHLAQVLLNKTDYEKGRAEFLERLNINQAEMILLFKESGLKTNDPFSWSNWNLPVKEVIENMEKIKEIPKTRGANLRWADLEEANLEEANLERANLRWADLEFANLERANLEGADLERANLERANLEGADLERANLVEANLYKANLEDCKFPKKYEYLLSEEQKEQVSWVA